MDNNLYISVFLAILSALLLLVFFLLRKIAKKNNVVTIAESRIEWKQMQCPTCGQSMQQGFGLAGKGIIWRNRAENRPGNFSTIDTALENTVNLRMRPALNMAWRCESCKLVLIDHSKMIQVKNDD